MARLRSGCPAAKRNRQRLPPRQAKGVTLKPTIVAYDGIGVIVKAENPITNLPGSRLSKSSPAMSPIGARLGKKSGTISIYTRNTSSGTYSELERAGDEETRLCTECAKNGRPRTNRGRSREESEWHWLCWAGLHESKRESKCHGRWGRCPLKLCAQINHGRMRGQRSITLTAIRAGLAKQFVEFTLSAAGQKIVDSVGFVPIQ